MWVASRMKVNSSPPRSSEAIEVSETPAAANSRRPTAIPIGSPIAEPRTAASEQPHQRVEAEPDDGERQRSREDVVDLLIGCGG